MHGVSGIDDQVGPLAELEAGANYGNVRIAKRDVRFLAQLYPRHLGLEVLRRGSGFLHR